MNTRLQPLTLADFTGGLNVRENSFQVADNESPAMLNVNVDERVGFATRQGWVRQTPADAAIGTWDPRHAILHQYHDGTFAVYVTNQGTIYRTDPAGNLVDTAITCTAQPHLADFTPWGDTLYIVTGSGSVPYKRDETAATAMTAAGVGMWNDDYTIPGTPGNILPSAALIEAHTGYLFVADVTEDFDGGGSARYPNRIRWSHPNSPEDWATLDFMDIELGGSRIRALKSFGDHILIFKDASVWGLYGYESESWQLVQVSGKSGTVSPTTVTKSESQCFYYSPNGRGAIFVVESGNRPESISEPIRQVLTETMATDNVWLGWIANRLICNLPWSYVDVPTADPSIDSRRGRTGSSPASTTTFVFDPSIGEGAWESHAPAFGHLRSSIELPGNKSPLAVHAGDATARCILRLGGATNDAQDYIHADGTPTPFLAYYTTNWKHAGTEELRKSWRRPRFIINNPEADIDIRVDAFRNYDLGAPYRSWVIGLDTHGRPYWRDLGAAAPEGDGFDWDDGTKWAGSTDGSRIVRGGPLGIARSIQLRITTIPNSDGKAWGVDAVTLKVINRRFTT